MIDRGQEQEQTEQIEPRDNPSWQQRRDQRTDQAQALILMGYGHWGLSQLDQARQALEKALALCPDRLEAKIGL